MRPPNAPALSGNAPRAAAAKKTPYFFIDVKGNVASLILLKNPGSPKTAAQKHLTINNSLFHEIANAGVIQQNQVSDGTGLSCSFFPEPRTCGANR
jgi:hypothetical protein